SRPRRPGAKALESGRTSARRQREAGRRREGGGWVRSSEEAEQCPGSEGALPFAMSPTQGRQGRDDKGVQRFAGPEAETIRQGEGSTVLAFLGSIRPRLKDGAPAGSVCDGQTKRWGPGNRRDHFRGHRGARRGGSARAAARRTDRAHLQATPS